jgi:FkbM family methyltransferase
MINYSGLSRSTFLGRALRAPLRLIPKQAAIPILQGPLKGKRWIAGASNHGCWLGSYEAPKQMLIARMVRPGMTCWDIGANVGFYTLLFAELTGNSGNVFAFEPFPGNVGLLRRHVEINKFSTVKVFPVALADFDGTVGFDPGPNSCMGHLAVDGRLTVPCSRLDTLLEAREIQPPDLIKIDVEGAEARVLRGAMQALGKRPVVFLATHGKSVHNECVNLLRGCGYSVQSLDGRALETTDEIVAIDTTDSK